MASCYNGKCPCVYAAVINRRLFVYGVIGSDNVIFELIMVLLWFMISYQWFCN